ncbi:hypothetical protein [Asticcacaulis sp. YBE204]|uniref:hypothetical protein n=1 Tax=Asticcacaulis sp. YBE204 TaxID=1282363 RepID=UPI0003C4048B|nr:hypothetical protein [Asticcacaulis sp. YBE204]ESQ79838.1 hypothetical protein AEYBE204_08310 [Asticcacaulis sp. YBE204]
MNMSRLPVVALAVALLSGGVAAHAADDETVVTNTRAPLPTEAEIAESKARTPVAPVSIESQIIDKVETLSRPERRVRTEVSASIGTGGYRSGYVATEIPVGETGTLGIAIGQTDYGKNNVLVYDRYGYGYDGYGYDDYGYPYDGAGYGRYGASYAGGYGYSYGRPRVVRGGKTQSIAISLDFSGDKTNRSARKDCEGFYDGGRYIEPVWATQMRGPGKCATDEKP